MSDGLAEAFALRSLVRGRVQGVFFRDFVRQHARRLGLVGYVRNLPDGATVEVHAQGPRAALGRLVALLWQGPPEARVANVEVRWETPVEGYDSFDVTG